MKIGKALERLTYSVEHNTILITRGDKEAIKLGIEALKAWKWMREHSGMSFDYYLPGETKD